MELTQKYLLDNFTYREDGNLIRKSGGGVGRARAGDVLGTAKPTSVGYKTTLILGKLQQVHRIIFFFHKGFMPEYIDHDDGDKTNNRIDNLLDTTQSANIFKSSRIPKYGYAGVYPQGKKWYAKIQIDNVQTRLGTFETKEDAIEARMEAEMEHYGRYSRDNPKKIEEICETCNGTGKVSLELEFC